MSLRPTFVFRGHLHSITQLAATGDGRIVFSGDAMGNVRAWDVAGSKRTIWQRRLHSSSIQSLLLAGQSTRLISHSRDGSVSVWPIERTPLAQEDHGNQDDAARIAEEQPMRITLAEEPMRTISTNHVGFCCCAWLEEADLLAVPNDRNISLYSLISSSSELPVNEITWDDKRYGMPMALRLMRDPSKNHIWMVVACESGDVLCVDALSGVLISAMRAHKEPVVAFDLSYPAGWGMSVSPDYHVRRWNIATSPTAPQTDSKVQEDRRGGAALLGSSHTLKAPPAAIAIRQVDGRIAAVGCTDGSVRVLRTKDCKFLGTLEARCESAQCVLFVSEDPIKNGLFVGGKNGNILLWNLY